MRALRPREVKGKFNVTFQSVVKSGIKPEADCEAGAL